MKEELKQIEGIPGIYAVVNLITGKTYIGATHNLYRRTKEHLNRSSNKALRADVILYGKKNFDFKILCLFENTIDQEEINIKEKYFIDYYQNLNTELYNNRDGGAGCLLSDETKEKISLAHIGLKKDDATKEKCGMENRKAVLCVETGEIYVSQTYAAKCLGIPQQKISISCIENCPTPNGCHFVFYDIGDE